MDYENENRSGNDVPPTIAPDIQKWIGDGGAKLVSRGRRLKLTPAGVEAVYWYAPSKICPIVIRVLVSSQSIDGEPLTISVGEIVNRGNVIRGLDYDNNLIPELTPQNVEDYMYRSDALGLLSLKGSTEQGMVLDIMPLFSRHDLEIITGKHPRLTARP